MDPIEFDRRTFRGAEAKAIYPGNGNVPLNADGAHWAASCRRDAANDHGRDGGCKPAADMFSPIDFAAMDDIGYDLVDLDTTITATHRYPDDGSYPTTVTLRGSQGGEIEYSLGDTVVTNVAPTLSVVNDRSVTEGESFSITNIGQITDPGFRNLNVDPATSETFTYTIQWGDGESDSGTATIDRFGNGPRIQLIALASPRPPTHRSTDLTNTLRRVSKQFALTVTDDDGGTDTETFQITVIAMPELSLAFSNSAIAENDGDNATTLTVSVSGPTTDEARQITLESSDLTEATVATTVSIPANASSVTVPVNAVDDTLLDGVQVAIVSASRSGFVSGSAELLIADVERISLTVSANTVVEGSDGDVNLMVTRSNTDVDEPIQVSLRRDFGQVGLVTNVEIPAGQQTLVLPLRPADDDIPELTTELEIAAQSPGYSGSLVSFNLADDEPPLFQNPDNRFDVNGIDGVSALDALIVINAIASRQTPLLDPATETPDGLFLDVNGDYQVTALDALQTINFVAANNSSFSQTGQTSQSQTGESVIAALQSDDRDDEDANVITNDAAIATMF